MKAAKISSSRRTRRRSGGSRRAGAGAGGSAEGVWRRAVDESVQDAARSEVALEELMTDNAMLPQDAQHVETEWTLIQTETLTASAASGSVFTGWSARRPTTPRSAGASS